MIVLKKITDTSTLLRWREEVIFHVFGQKANQSMLLANRKYYENHIADGSHVDFVAEDSDGIECGCGAACFTDELPSPDNPSGKCAYLMNIYVREAHRNRGIAHCIVSRLVDEAKKRGCGKIYLESTDEGKPVYRSLGFVDMPDMMKYHDKKI